MRARGDGVNKTISRGIAGKNEIISPLQHGMMAQNSLGGASSSLVPSKSTELHWYFATSLGF